MKNKLSKLSEKILIEISSSLGRPVATKEQAIIEIKELCKGYGLSYSDLASRYNLPK